MILCRYQLPSNRISLLIFLILATNHRHSKIMTFLVCLQLTPQRPISQADPIFNLTLVNRKHRKFKQPQVSLLINSSSLRLFYLASLKMSSNLIVSQNKVAIHLLNQSLRQRSRKKQKQQNTTQLLNSPALMPGQWGEISLTSLWGKLQNSKRPRELSRKPFI